MTPPPEPTLVTIPFSHYCERARWALEHTGVPFREEGHLPLLQVIAARRAGGGRTVPVLVLPDGRVLPDSTPIVAYADELAPADRRLYPDQGREEVLARERGFTERLGPATRLAFYGRMASRADLARRHWPDPSLPRWESRLVPVLYPLLRRGIVLHFSIDEAAIQRALGEVRAVFDEVDALLADGRTHLCGDRFTAADLTFASMAAPLLAPPQYGSLDGFDPAETPIAEIVAELRARPAGRHALATYASDRR